MRVRARGGFTLVELLVVVTVLLILTAMTVYAVNFTLSSERINAASRQVQSYLEGAKSRAIYARENRGVRFILSETPNDAGNHTMVESMAFVGPAPDVSSENGDGRILLMRPDDDNDGVPDSPNITIVRGFLPSPLWWELSERGLLFDGSKIDLIDNSGRPSTYAVRTDLLGPGSNEQVLRLTTPYRETGSETPDTSLVAYGGDGPTQYRLHLPPTILPGEEPVLLPDDIVINLAASRVPGAWFDNASGNFRSTMDVIFTPRGNVAGAAGALGQIHLTLTETHDAQFGMPADAPSWTDNTAFSSGEWVKPTSGNATGFWYLANNAGTTGGSPPQWPGREGAQVSDNSITWTAISRGDRKLVSIFTTTGNIETDDIYSTTTRQVDPFRYVEVGQ